MRPCPKLSKSQVDELHAFVSSYGPTATELKRSQAILLRDRETDIDEITFITGYHRRHLFNLRKRYLDRGIEGLRSPKNKKKRLLTRKQLGEIIRTIKKKRPNEVGYGEKEEFWTTAILADYISKIYNVRYQSSTSYYLIFKEAKFTYHKPGKTYHKRNEQQVRIWRKKARKKLQKAWEDPNTVILAEDELILSTQTTTQKVWLPANQYPKVEVSNNRENRSVYGFLNLKTGKQSAYIAKRQNMHITTKVLQRLRKTYPRNDNGRNKKKGVKLLILWDGAGWHRGSKVQEYIKRDNTIKTIYFPPYAPEENPQEHVWKEARSEVTHNQYIEDIDKAANDFVNYLNNTIFPYSLLGFSARK